MLAETGVFADQLKILLFNSDGVKDTSVKIRDLTVKSRTAKHTKLISQ